MKKIISLTLIIILSLNAQDEIIFKDGRNLLGEADTESINESSNSIRFKPQGWKIFSFYNIEEINFVKSWNGKILYPKGVAVNLETGKYHLPNVIHAPKDDNRKYFRTLKSAIDAGYLPCYACYDTHPNISDYSLEKELVKAAIIQIQNSNEILYEHPNLPKLQLIMENILIDWPEKLKGYEYRIQIIRDDEPNAYALAGGNLYFTSGLLKMLEDDNELESILAHEIAHVERRHFLRGYKEKQSKEAALALATLMIAIVAVAAESEEGIALAGAVGTIGQYAIDFVQIGYKRDLEQEADMMAQIYLQHKNKSLEPMIAMIDKLATTSKTRFGYVPTANAFSSHPDLISRIEQLKNGKFFEYEEPMKMIFHPSAQKNSNLESGFLEMNFKYAYKTISSDKKDVNEIFLIGSIVNNHESMSFQINNISLNFLGSLGVTSLGGIVDIVVPYESETEFVGRIQSPKEHAEAVENSIYNKKMLPFFVQISGIVMRPGKNAKQVVGMKNIMCSMTIN